MGIWATLLKKFPLVILLFQIKFFLPTELPYNSIHLYKISPFEALIVHIIGLDLILFAHNKCDQILIGRI